MLRMAQHVDVSLTNPPSSSPLPVYPNLLLASNYMGILNTSGFSLLVRTSLFPYHPQLSFYYFSKGKYHVEICIILLNILFFLIVLCQ